MGETAAGVGNLEVSVSFGRFENDLLSWERWSSFSQNKYLEEVEKCSTPGSVAEKKAYFEAHYKKIAAKKAEIEDQQKQFEATLSLATKTSWTSTIIKNIKTDNKHKQLEADSLVEEKPTCASPAAEKSEIKIKCKQLELHLTPENNSGAYPNQMSRNGTADFHSSDCQTDDIQLVKERTNLNNEPRSSNVLEKASDGYTDVMLQTNISVREKQESNFRSDLSEAVDGFVWELEHEAHFKGFPWLVEAPKEAKLDTVEVLKLSTEEMTELNTHKMTKVPLTTAEKRVTKVKRAPISVKPKSPQNSSSTPKRMMLTSTPSMVAKSRSSAVKGSNSESSIMSSRDKLKKPAPRSDTVSPSPVLRRDATVSAPPKPTSKEKARDMDIVKRAFKSFQPDSDPETSFGERCDSLRDQVPRNAKETNVKEIVTSHKGKEWLHRTGAIRPNIAQKTAPLLADPSADTMTRKGKEMKKVSMNPNVKAAAGSRILAKSKVVMESNAKDQQQSRMFKATPLPEFYRGTRVKKSVAGKEDPKSQSTDKHSDKHS